MTSPLPCPALPRPALPRPAQAPPTKLSATPYADPFLMRIEEGETVGQLRERVRAKLGAGDDEELAAVLMTGG